MKQSPQVSQLPDNAILWHHPPDQVHMKDGTNLNEQKAKNIQLKLEILADAVKQPSWQRGRG